MKLIDTHAHILSTSYNENLNEVIEEIKSKEMIIFNISFNLKSSQEVLNLFEKYNFLKPVIGIHPVDTKGYCKNVIEELEKMINSNIVAIGEIGLDYHYEGYDKNTQKEAFVDQIKLAQKYNLPIVVHTRDSLEDCYEIIKDYPDQKFLLHSWAGDKILTQKIMDNMNNVYFSYNGIITFKNAQLQNEVIQIIPTERLLFETDCPYLSPTPFRGKTNYPWRTEDVIKYCSNLLNISFEELMQINHDNVLSFYNIEKEELK